MPMDEGLIVAVQVAIAVLSIAVNLVIAYITLKWPEWQLRKNKV